MPYTDLLGSVGKGTSKLSKPRDSLNKYVGGDEKERVGMDTCLRRNDGGGWAYRRKMARQFVQRLPRGLF